MTLEIGKTYIPANVAEVRDDILTDLRLGAIDAGIAEPPVQEGTDWYILASAVAENALLQYANIRIAEDNTSVLEAEGDALRRIGEGLGLPEVEPTPSSGKVRVSVISGATTIVAGSVLVLPNGKTAEVIGTHVGVTDGGLVDVQALQAGAGGNYPGGTKVRFVSPPINVKTEAEVSSTSPLTNGADAESDARRRTRILNRLRNTPSGGNWAHIREIALTASAALRDVFVYPALGGPASVKVVPVKHLDPALLDWSPVPTVAQINAVADKIRAELPDSVEVVVQAPISFTALSPTVLVSVPESSQAGGNGTGWVDSVVWPQLVAADFDVVTISTVTSTTVVVLTANTTTAPVPGQSHIMWWSVVDQKFRTRLITGVTGSAGAWSVTVSEPMVDSLGNGPSVGEYVSPALANADAYGKTWVSLVESFGPNENTADANRLPRSLRHPLATDEQPSTFTSKQLTALQSAHPEIRDIAWGVTSSLPSPATVAAAPYIYQPVSFGIYKK